MLGKIGEGDRLGVDAAVEAKSRKGLIARIWTVLASPSGRFTLATLVVFGGVAGFLAALGLALGMEKANTLEFCTSCHEMQTVYQEYQQSIHFKNASGVRAICADCHVPRPLLLEIKRKIEASNELWHKFLGTIDTPEKFEQHRLALAESVWATMRATNSRECHNCHEEDAFDIHKQSEDAQKVMMPGLEAGLTCIDCHMGIAHHLPKTSEKSEQQPKTQ
jgi:nitrate/TMAO reductase-like tetraheme cytochrome c subunit